MYLTRMHLNPARRGTRNLLASPQRMHAAVMCAFPRDVQCQPKDSRVLWRVDRTPSSTSLYISSPSRPDLTHVVEQAGWPTASDPWQTVDAESFLERLEQGQRWAFRVTANPVRSQRAADGGRGKRYGHVTVDQQEGWLRERGESCGFVADAVTVVSRRQLSFTRGEDGRGRRVTISTATFDGTLSVLDRDSLKSAIRWGIGRAKGYGCGLITLAPQS